MKLWKLNYNNSNNYNKDNLLKIVKIIYYLKIFDLK